MIIYECPYDACDLSIIGSGKDLRKHVEENHPLLMVIKDEERGMSMREMLNEAEQNHLKHRINTEMVVEADSDE